MPALSTLYCGMWRYFSNSAAQAAAESGGTMPATGCHSVIDSPDRVSRVMPPITTMQKIMPQQNSSQTATGRALVVVATLASSAAGSAIAVGTDTQILPENPRPFL